MFNVIFYQPILNVLIWLYLHVAFLDLGFAIILLTIVIKAILWPLSQQSVKAQKSLQEVQPKLEALKKEFANNKEAQAKATIALYKEHKINPFASCLPLLIQLPFFFAVFQVFRDITAKDLNGLIYFFVSKGTSIQINPHGFFNLLDLSKPNPYLAVLAGAAQFWQAKMMSTQKPPIKDSGAKDESMAAIMNKQMLYMMPVMTVVIGVTLPSGLSLYWLVLTLLTILQQYIVFKQKQAVTV
ncbi:MAG: YidC/Oxa1 family membrane protein insertase [Candidatus Falkowbacteria bacterium]